MPCLDPIYNQYDSMNWAQAFILPLALITTIALSALAMQGHITTLEWGYGNIAAVSLPFIASLISWDEAEGCVRSSALTSFIFQGLIVALTMAGVAPLVPMAITLITYNAFYGSCSSQLAAPLCKQMTSTNS